MVSQFIHGIGHEMVECERRTLSIVRESASVALPESNAPPKWNVDKKKLYKCRKTRCKIIVFIWAAQQRHRDKFIRLNCLIIAGILHWMHNKLIISHEKSNSNKFQFDWNAQIICINY